jgi:hypothetical protein
VVLKKVCRNIAAIYSEKAEADSALKWLNLGIQFISLNDYANLA